VLDHAAAIETDEAAVVRPRSAFVLDDVVEEAADDGIDDGALDAEPKPSRMALRVGSGIAVSTWSSVGDILILQV
jgi:hypothetical protein